MFWIMCGLLVVAEAAKLDKTYLPPTGAKESGGSDSDLQVPLEPPYIDPYTPQQSFNQKTHSLRPGTRSTVIRRKPSEHLGNDQPLENEDDIVVPTPLLGKGRFISGSYSYTGPDNVLVTVTYTADDRKGREKDVSSEEVEEEQVEEDSEQEEEDDYNPRAIPDAEDSDVDGEDGAIPTPPSLPAELARAFDFHKRKQQEAEERSQERKAKKTLEERTHQINKTKKPIGGHKIKDIHQQRPANFGMKIKPLHNKNHNGYQPQNSYGTPTIHQGYSYPKQN